MTVLHYSNDQSRATGLPAPRRRVSGRYLAHNRLNARGRAQLAADILAGRVQVDGATLTVGQAAKLARANRVYVDEARFPGRVKSHQLKVFTALFEAIGPSARAEACREIGVERVWDALSRALLKTDHHKPNPLRSLARTGEGTHQKRRNGGYDEDEQIHRQGVYQSRRPD
jgi:hypothetical protein